MRERASVLYRMQPIRDLHRVEHILATQSGPQCAEDAELSDSDLRVRLSVDIRNVSLLYPGSLWKPRRLSPPS